MELLNGKAKELFEKWYNENIGKKISVGHLSLYTLSESMINSVIIEWLDSIGYNIIITPYATCITLGDDLVGLDGTWSFFVYKSKELMLDGVDFESRQEATTEAIKKAVELINESNGK